MANIDKFDEKFRTRNWATVCYPESMKCNLVDILTDQHIPCLISPLHDSDVNPDSGEIKKAHYHVLFLFDGVKTRQQVSTLVDLIGGVGLEVVNSARAYARYLVHMDNPDKYQYDKDSVTCLGGADFFSLISSPSDKYGTIMDMAEYIHDNDIINFEEFFVWTMHQKPDWFRLMCDSQTFLIRTLIKSNRDKLVDKYQFNR